MVWEVVESSEGAQWKDVIKNFTKLTGKRLCQNLFFNKVAGLRLAALLKKETLTQVFSFEFCQIFNNTFFYRTPREAAYVLFFDCFSISFGDIEYVFTRF